MTKRREFVLWTAIVLLTLMVIGEHLQLKNTQELLSYVYRDVYRLKGQR